MTPTPFILVKYLLSLKMDWGQAVACESKCSTTINFYFNWHIHCTTPVQWISDNKIAFVYHPVFLCHILGWLFFKFRLNTDLLMEMTFPVLFCRHYCYLQCKCSRNLKSKTFAYHNFFLIFFWTFCELLSISLKNGKKNWQNLIWFSESRSISITGYIVVRLNVWQWKWKEFVQPSSLWCHTDL